MLNAIKLGLSKFASFSGRSTRAEFGWWMVFCILVFGLSWIIGKYIGVYEIVIIGIYVAAMAIPTSAIFARRLHDIGKQGWWQIPMCSMGGIGAFFVLLGWLGFVFGILMFYLAIFLLLFSFTGVTLIALCIMWAIFWLGRVGDEGPNLYGVDPRLE